MTNEMTNEITFEIKNTPENRAAFEELRKQIYDGTLSIYAPMEDGTLVPIMDVKKHPGCPDGLYIEMLKKIAAL